MARSAQAEFERFRRAHLPFGAPLARIEEQRIGRFRYFHDPDEPPELPAEPPKIREARARLLEKLGEVDRLSPGDEWVVGQRVRYWIEQGSAAEALHVARECGSSSWCRALEGLALHVAGDYVASEAAFDTALRTLPQKESCRWVDAGLLLKGRLRKEYKELGCAERDDFHRLLWWLSEPLFLIPGNERRTEHLARATMTRILQDARNAYGTEWDSDLSEITLRYGWTIAWSAEVPRYGGTWDGPRVWGHQRSPGYHFLPHPAALHDPFIAGDAAWELRRPAPREQYAPTYAESFGPFPHQSALFRRGDSILFLAAYDLRALDVRDSLEAALVLSGGPHGPHAMIRSNRTADVLIAHEVGGALLAGLEALDRGTRRAFRARYGLPQPATDRVTVSDLLVLDTAAGTPSRLGEALSHVLPTVDLGAKRRIVVFWETYGLAAGGEPVTISLVVFRGRRRVHRLEWEQLMLPAEPAAGRSLAVDLSALKRGSYRLELSVAVAEQDPAVAVREITLGR